MTDSVPAPLSAGPRVPFEDMLTAEEVLGRCLQRRPRTGDAAKMLREIRERYGFDLVRSDAERRDADRSEGGALQQALRVIAPIAHQWEPDDAHRRTGGPILGDFALCEHPRCRAANALLRAVVSEPSSEMAAAISRVQRGIAKRALAATPAAIPARAATPAPDYRKALADADHLLVNWLFNEDGENDEWLNEAHDIIRRALGDDFAADLDAAAERDSARRAATEPAGLDVERLALAVKRVGEWVEREARHDGDAAWTLTLMDIERLIEYAALASPATSQGTPEEERS